MVATLLSLGAIPVPLHPQLTSGERKVILEQLQPHRVITDPADLQLLADPVAAQRVWLGRPMHFTSGTTGVPKGVWGGTLTPQQSTLLWDEEASWWGHNQHDRHLVLSPLYHSAPLRFALATLRAGGTLVGLPHTGAPPRFDPANVTELIQSERPTTMFCVPTQLQRLLTYWDNVGYPDLSCFRLVAHAGAACPPALKERLLTVFPPHTTWEFYGATEGQFTACTTEEWSMRRGTVGRARPGRVLSVDVDNQVWAQVPEYARFTYWRSPTATAQAWRGNAFTVGDLGWLDAEGYLYLVGRRTDLIISGGVNVYPLEVENVLRACPGVTDIAVYGVDDPRWGQRVAAAVVGEVSHAEITQFARDHLIAPKRPKTYRFVASLPRTVTGKVQRQLLAD